MNGKTCAACNRRIDRDAKLCPYCGSDPETGERFDPKPILDSHFPKKETGRGSALKEFFEERQGMVVALVVVAVFIVLGAIHQTLQRRAEAQTAADVTPLPLTEVADLNDQGSDEDQPLPDIEFPYGGRARTMRVLLVEPGEVAPPPEPATSTAPQEQTKAPPRPRRPQQSAAAAPPQPDPAPQSATTETQTQSARAENEAETVTPPEPPLQ